MDQRKMVVLDQASREVPTSYLAVELSENGPVLRRRKLVPRNAQKGFLVLKLLACGVCSADLKEIRGARTVRHDFGHEFVGIIIAKSRNLGLKIGDWVVYDPHVKLRNRTSGFAEMLLAEGRSEALTKAFIAVSKNIPVNRLVFVEPLACANHCIFRLLMYLGKRNLKSKNIAVVGAGNFGLLTGFVINYLGGKVTIFNRSLDRIKFIKQLKIIPDRQVKSFNEWGDHTFDVVIPTTTFLYPDVMGLSLKLLQKDGLLLLFGGTKKGDGLKRLNVDLDSIRRNQDLLNIETKNLSFRIGGTYGAETEDFLKAMGYLRKSRYFPLEKLIREKISLKSLPRTLRQLAKTGQLGKTVVPLS